MVKFPLPSHRLLSAILPVGCVVLSAMAPTACTRTKAPAPAGEPTEATIPAWMHVVNCNQKVQSKKRGICANRLDPADFKALAPGVSWYYNWSPTPGRTGIPPEGIPMEFIPMVWAGNPGDIEQTEKYLAAGNRPRVILCINEPNLQGQAMMSPAEAANRYRNIKEVTDKYHIPLAGPNMSIGSPPSMSVRAYDPFAKAEITYTDMRPFLKAFLFYAEKQKTDVVALGMHPYMPAAGVAGLMDAVGTEFNRALWVTEYANSEGPRTDLKAKLIDLMQATDYLERSPWIAGYSYFKERNSVFPELGLFENAPGKLNALGKAYVNMPVHEANIYYSVPGRLEAESYLDMKDLSIWPTSDVDGFAHMRADKPGAFADYNVFVNEGGTYTLDFRVTGAAGQIELMEAGTKLGSADVTGAEQNWTDIQMKTAFARGAHTIRVQFDVNPQGLHWIAFNKQ